MRPRRAAIAGIALVAAAACTRNPEPRAGSSAVAPAAASSSVAPPVAASPWERHLVSPVGLRRPAPGGKALAFQAVATPAGLSGIAVVGAETRFFDRATLHGWADDRHVVGTRGRDLLAFDVTTGKERILGVGITAPAFGDGVLGVFVGGGEPVRLVDPATGRELRRFPFPTIGVRTAGGGRFVLVGADRTTVVGPSLAVEHEADGGPATVMADGAVIVAVVTGGSTRLELFDREVARKSPPLPGRLVLPDDAARRSGDVVVAAVGGRVVRWDLRTNRISTLVTGGGDLRLELTSDAKHVCIDEIATAFDVATGKPAPRGHRCVARAKAPGDVGRELFDFGDGAERLQTISLVGGGEVWGLRTDEAIVFARENLVHCTRTADGRAVREPERMPFRMGLLGAHSVLAVGLEPRVLRLDAPVGSVDVPGPRLDAADGFVHARLGTVDADTLAIEPAEGPSDAFHDVAAGRVAAGMHVVDLGTGASALRGIAHCGRSLRSDGGVLDTVCAGGLVLSTPDGEKKELHAAPSSSFRPTSRDHVWAKDTAGARLLLGEQVLTFTEPGPVLVAGDFTALVPESGEIVETSRTVRAPPTVLLAVADAAGLLVSDRALRTFEGAVIAELPEPASFASFGPDATRVAVADARRVRVLDTRTGAIVLSFARTGAPRALTVTAREVLHGGRAGLEAVALADGAAISFVADERGRILRLSSSGVTDLTGRPVQDLAGRVLCRRRGDRGGLVPCPPG